jgi:hypothetical protein
MDPQLKAKVGVVEYYNGVSPEQPIAPPEAYQITVDDLETVWYAWILGGWKTLIMVSKGKPLYFEVTYNAAEKEMYIDVYEKLKNVCIKDDLLAELREKLSGDAR